MAPLLKLTTLLSLSIYVAAQGLGTQFITGVCTSDADCASGCCGFNTGKCAGPVVAQERDGGCGFGDAQPNDRAAQRFRNGQGAAPIAPPNNGNGNGNGNGNVNNVNGNGNGNGNNGGNGAGNGIGRQFITGPCLSDADCASACCGFKSGKCAGPIVAQERDGGCGFGDSQPNDKAAQAIRGQRLGKRGVAYWRQEIN